MKLSFVCLLACGCWAPRYYDRPIVWVLHDDAPIAKPAENPLAIQWTGARDMILLPVDRALTLDYGIEANDVNALDEVPESSWYHDPRRGPGDAMLGDRTLTSAEIERGITRADDEPVPPFTIVKGKSIGSTRGFVALDRRGVRYAIKLDPPRRPGLATSVEVVVSRLAWACGWRVPAEVMIQLRLDQLSIGKGATTEDEWGKKRPFDPDDLKRLLAGIEVEDGHILALASRWLPGKSAGPFRYFGRRGDDPNDHFAHENRRELRGFGVFAAWVNDIDTMENNTLDMYEGPPGHGHLVHYEQDVGGAFGVWASGPMEYWMGHETYFDGPEVFLSLLSLGTYPTHWEDREYRADFDRRAKTDIAFAGFDAEHFEPRRWRPVAFNAAFSRQTARDRYWAAKHIALIGEAELHAAIDSGHYDAHDAVHLYEILSGRRARLLRDYLGDVAALDFFRIRQEGLCFEDIWLRAGLGGLPRYDAQEDRRRLETRPRAHGGCVELPPRAGYHVVVLGVTRGRSRRSLRVHLVSTGNETHIVGLER